MFSRPNESPTIDPRTSGSNQSRSIFNVVIDDESFILIYLTLICSKRITHIHCILRQILSEMYVSTKTSIIEVTMQSLKSYLTFVLNCGKLIPSCSKHREVKQQNSTRIIAMLYDRLSFFIYLICSANNSMWVTLKW